MTITPFGTTAQGQEAVLLTMKNKADTQVTLTNFGARLVGILAADKHGQMTDVCLGFDTVQDYETRSGYLGATIGRWGNRIFGASFELNGKTYPLYANDGANTLHGGKEGFDQKIWDYVVVNDQEVVFQYVSPDMEEGFPGALKTTVTFTLGEDSKLSIAYTAQSDKDTVINLTNHAYFNLAGQGTVHGHLLQVQADTVTATTEDLIPTGELMPVDGTPYYLRTPKLVGDCLAMKGVSPMFDSAEGFDINYVVKGSGLREAAVLKDSQSGRVMRVWTDQPAIQVYSGQGLSGPAKNGQKHEAYSGIALETQHYPDSVHHAHFPSTVLKAGDVFQSQTIYGFSAE